MRILGRPRVALIKTPAMSTPSNSMKGKPPERICSKEIGSLEIATHVSDTKKNTRQTQRAGDRDLITLLEYQRMTRKVRLILGSLTLNILGNACCQSSWVRPDITSRLPDPSSSSAF